MINLINIFKEENNGFIKEKQKENNINPVLFLSSLNKMDIEVIFI